VEAQQGELHVGLDRALVVHAAVHEEGGLLGLDHGRARGLGRVVEELLEEQARGQILGRAGQVVGLAQAARELIEEPDGLARGGLGPGVTRRALERGGDLVDVHAPPGATGLARALHVDGVHASSLGQGLGPAAGQPEVEHHSTLR
jgi:hypothetical protein